MEVSSQPPPDRIGLPAWAEHVSAIVFLCDYKLYIIHGDDETWLNAWFKMPVT